MKPEREVGVSGAVRRTACYRWNYSYCSTGTSASVAYLGAIISWSTDNTEATLQIKQLTLSSYTTQTVAQFWRPGRVNTMAAPNRNYKFYKSTIEFPFIRLDNLKIWCISEKILYLTDLFLDSGALGSRTTVPPPLPATPLNSTIHYHAKNVRHYQKNSLNNFTTHFYSINFNFILPSMPRSDG